MSLSGVEIMEALRRAGHVIPADAKIFFDVPGGGDWSNTEIEIDEGRPLRIEWKTVTEESSDG